MDFSMLRTGASCIMSILQCLRFWTNTGSLSAPDSSDSVFIYPVYPLQICALCFPALLSKMSALHTFKIQTSHEGSISITRRSIKTATVGVDDGFPSSPPFIESGGSAPLTFSLPQTPQINNILPHLVCQYEPRRPVRGWGMCADQFTWIPMRVILLRRQR